MANVHIDVQHVTRAGGQVNIVAHVKNGVLEECRLEIADAPRFFEAMLCGRPYSQSSHIASRLCGLCAVAHATASLRAIENALGITPSEQTRLLRRLNLDGEMLDSHVLHVYVLVAPDWLGAPSFISLAQAAPELVQRALRIKKLAGDLCAAVGGRHIHPIALAVGGFTHYPTLEQLKALRERLVDARADMDATVRLARSFKWPPFTRETEYAALRQENEYAFIDGTLTTTGGGAYLLPDYRQLTDAHQPPHAPYRLGALARFNVNYDKLHPYARAAAEDLGLKPVCANPFLNTSAQVVEMVHCVEEAIDLLDELVVRGIKPEPRPPFPGRGGTGVGACESPRGTVVHDYQLGDDGRLASARCVTPTGQNLASIEADMRQWLPHILDRPPDDMRRLLEMLVRAYDPCLSC